MKVYKQFAKRLHGYTGLEVVQKDTISRKPKYPYIAYKFITPYMETLGDVRGIRYDENSDKLYEVLESQPQMVISIDGYSNDLNEALNLIKQIRDWLKFKGKRDIYELEIVVVDIGNITDRSLRIEGFYEYRYGLDVRIRTHDRLENEVGYIEKIKPNIDLRGGKNR